MNYLLIEIMAMINGSLFDKLGMTSLAYSLLFFIFIYIFITLEDLNFIRLGIFVALIFFGTIIRNDFSILTLDSFIYHYLKIFNLALCFETAYILYRNQLIKVAIKCLNQLLNKDKVHHIEHLN